MKPLILLILLCLSFCSLRGQTYKLEAVRVVGATYDHPMADIKPETVTFTFDRNGSITISDSAGLKLYFNRSKAMELCDLTSVARHQIGASILNQQVQQSFDAGTVLARDGYYVDVGVPSASDIGKTLLFAGLKVEKGQMGLFYSVRDGAGAVCAIIFLDVVDLGIVLERWKAKYYH